MTYLARAAGAWLFCAAVTGLKRGYRTIIQIFIHSSCVAWVLLAEVLLSEVVLEWSTKLLAVALASRMGQSKGGLRKTRPFVTNTTSRNVATPTNNSDLPTVTSSSSASQSCQSASSTGVLSNSGNSSPSSNTVLSSAMYDISATQSDPAIISSSSGLSVTTCASLPFDTSPSGAPSSSSTYSSPSTVARLSVTADDPSSTESVLSVNLNNPSTTYIAPVSSNTNSFIYPSCPPSSTSRSVSKTSPVATTNRACLNSSIPVNTSGSPPATTDSISTTASGSNDASSGPSTTATNTTTTPATTTATITATTIITSASTSTSTTTTATTSSFSSPSSSSPSTTGTTASSSHEVLCTGDINYLKILKASDALNGRILTAFYEAHFPGGTQAFVDWLLTTNQNWRRGFNKDQLDMIESRAKFQDMDITLQFKILSRWCNFRPLNDPCWQSDKESEEYWLYCIKEQRNELAHEMKMLSQTLGDEAKVSSLFDKLKDISLTAIDKLKCYKIGKGSPVGDLDVLKQDVEKSLNTLKSQHIIVEVEPTKYALKTGSIQETKQQEDLRDIQPFPDILGLEPFPLQKIYQPPDLYIEKRGLDPGDTQRMSLPVKKLFTTPMPDKSIPNIICVEGPSGAGKSTLLAHLVADHLDNVDSVEEMKTFDLVLHFPCKCTTCGTTLTDFLKSSLPKTTSDISDDLLLRTARNLKILVMADGFDEVSQEGRTLLKELYQIARHGKLYILLTTRSGSMNEAISNMGGTKCLRVMLSTVPSVKTETLVKKYYGCLRTRMTSPPPADEVVKAVGVAAERLERTPRNLLLLTYLACVQPEKVRAPVTVPELLEALDQIYLQMLHDRLLACRHLSTTQIHEEIFSFSQALNAAALESVLRGDVDISQDVLCLIAGKCTQPNDMLDAFLSCRRHRTVSGDKVNYTFPHASQLEYRAALSVRDRLLKETSSDKSSAELLKQILQLKELEQKEKDFKLGKLENFLLTLVGVFQLSRLLPLHAEELAELVVYSHESDWDIALAAISYSKMDKMFTEAVNSRMCLDYCCITSGLHVLKALTRLPKVVSIDIQNCCNDEPGLLEAIEVLRGGNLEMRLAVTPCLKDMCIRGCCTWPIAKLSMPGATCSVWGIYGPFDANTTLPASVETFLLCVQSPESMTSLKSQVNNLPKLVLIIIGITPRAGDMQSGPPIKKSIFQVWVYDVTDEDLHWTVNLFTSLQLHRKYDHVNFYNCSLTPSGYAALVVNLAERNVRISSVKIALATQLKKWQAEEENLKKLTKKIGSSLIVK